MSKKKSNPIIAVYILLLMISLGGFFFALFHIGKWYLEGNKIREIEKEIEDTVQEEVNQIKSEESFINPPSDKESVYYYYINFPFLKVDFDALKKINQNTVGFLKVNGTNINYPVVYSGDNIYYLKHDFDKSYNDAGWVFLDYRNNLDELAKNNVIYGHGRWDNTIFGTLKNVLDRKWQSNKDNHVIRLSTPKYNYLFQIFSAYSIEAESYYITTGFSNDGSFQEFINTLQSRNETTIHTDVTTDDKILTLSTCKNNNGIRVVVHAKLIAMENRK